MDYVVNVQHAHDGSAPALRAPLNAAVDVPKRRSRPQRSRTPSHRISSTRLSTWRAAARPQERHERLGRRARRPDRRPHDEPLPLRQPAARADRAEQPHPQLQRRRRARHEPDPEPGAGRLAHRRVRAQRQHRRDEAALAQPLLGHRARARARLAQQPRPPRQLLDRDPAPLGQRVVRRGDEHDLVDPERLADQPVVVRHAPGDRDVGPVLEQPREHLAPVADVQVDVELGMRVAERADERRDDVVAGRRHRADAQRRAAALDCLARRAPALLEQPEHVRRVRRERRARRSSGAARGRRARAASRRPRARARRPPPTPTAG